MLTQILNLKCEITRNSKYQKTCRSTPRSIFLQTSIGNLYVFGIKMPIYFRTILWSLKASIRIVIDGIVNIGGDRNSCIFFALVDVNSSRKGKHPTMDRYPATQGRKHRINTLPLDRVRIRENCLLSCVIGTWDAIGYPSNCPTNLY